VQMVVQVAVNVFRLYDDPKVVKQQHHTYTVQYRAVQPKYSLGKRIGCCLLVGTFDSDPRVNATSTILHKRHF
jgi:BioD-like phosphotransacetylase family protein